MKRIDNITLTFSQISKLKCLLRLLLMSDAPGLYGFFLYLTYSEFTHSQIPLTVNLSSIEQQLTRWEDER